jgi:hypothetical protein
MSERKKLSREVVVLTWLQRGIEAFFIAFKMGGPEARYRPFFDYMGFELLCKSYLLGCRAKDYENLSFQNGLAKVNAIAKKELGHNLWDIICKILRQKPTGKIAIILSRDFDGFSGDDFIKTLEAAYVECRYPVPEPISKKFPIPGSKGLSRDPILSTGLTKFSYTVAREILSYIKDDFSIEVPQGFLETLIPKSEFLRFSNLFFIAQ